MPSGIYIRTEEYKKYCSKKRHTEETKKKMSESRKKEKNSNWKGGIAKDSKYWERKRKERQVRKIENGGSHTIGEWEALKAQYNWACPSCHRSGPDIILCRDHIIPLVKGGSDNIENIQPLCGSCKNAKRYFKIGNKVGIGNKNRLGKPHTEETKNKMRGEKNPKWRGDESGYRAKHSWINNNYGKATKCSICLKTGNGKEIHWANKDHKYRLKREDWFEACSSCHGEYDKTNKLRKHKCSHIGEAEKIKNNNGREL